MATVLLISLVEKAVLLERGVGGVGHKPSY